MSIPTEALAIFEDPLKFHYKQYWLQTQNEEQTVLFELFAFGTINDIPKQMVLSPLMLKKLQLLTMISLSQCERELTYSKIMEVCAISSIDKVERYMIELRNFFSVKLDPIRESARIESLNDARDVYGGEKPLLLDIRPLHTKAELIDKLTHWQHKLNKQIKQKP